MNTKTLITLLRAQRPSYRNDAEKLILLVNTIFMNEGFKLVELGNNVTQEPANSQQEEISLEQWNAQDGIYNFKYVPLEGERYQKGLILKAIPMQESIVIFDLQDQSNEGDQMSTVDLKISDYVIPDKNDLTQSFQNVDKLDRNIKLGLGVFGSQSEYKQGEQEKQYKQRLEDESTQGGSRGSTQPQETYPVPPGFRPGEKPLNPSIDDVHNVVGPNHPVFNKKINPDDRLRDPRFIKPPGARYDPVNPPGLPGFTPESLYQTEEDAWNDLGPPPGIPGPGRGGRGGRGGGPGGFGGGRGGFGGGPGGFGGGSGFDFI